MRVFGRASEGEENSTLPFGQGFFITVSDAAFADRSRARYENFSRLGCNSGAGCRAACFQDGWPVNLYDVENYIKEIKGEHGSGLDHGNLDLNPDIGVASLENVTTYIWRLVKERFPNLEEVELKRGMAGSTEGCIYRGESPAGSSLAA